MNQIPEDGNRKTVQFDYEKQVWIVNGVYQCCGHSGPCSCYGKKHAGDSVPTPGGERGGGK